MATATLARIQELIALHEAAWAAYGATIEAADRNEPNYGGPEAEAANQVANTAEEDALAALLAEPAAGAAAVVKGQYLQAYHKKMSLQDDQVDHLLASLIATDATAAPAENDAIVRLSETYVPALDTSLCSMQEMHRLVDVFAALSTLANALIDRSGTTGNGEVTTFLDEWQAFLNEVADDIGIAAFYRRPADASEAVYRGWIIAKLRATDPQFLEDDPWPANARGTGTAEAA